MNILKSNESTIDYSYGQWVGWSRDENGNESKITVNLEKRSPGRAQILGHVSQNPAWRTSTDTMLRESGNIIIIESPDTRVFELQTGQLIPVKDFFAKHNIKEAIPNKTTYTITERGKIIAGSWETELNLKGTFRVENTVNDPPAKANHVLNWKKFKEFVIENYLDKEFILFRGQPDNTYKLRTSFHRSHRNNLIRYLYEDVPRLRHAVNAVSSFYYPDNNSEHLGALLSLAQHHGYPTPLLDWTSSPYIAAYFAFTEPFDKIKPPSAVRILVFDSAKWHSTPSSNLIHDPMPNVTFLRFAAHNNPRFIPQQSMASFSNVDDIETHVRTIEKQTNNPHLTVIDIPLSEKRAVLNELHLMGITRGSMFPGLDGVCRTLSEQYFDSE